MSSQETVRRVWGAAQEMRSVGSESFYVGVRRARCVKHVTV